MSHRDAAKPDSDAVHRALTRRSLLASLVFPAAAVAAGCATSQNAKRQPTIALTDHELGFEPKLGATKMESDGTRSFRNHLLHDQDGNAVRYQDDLIRGQIFAATFMYVDCKGICSEMTGKMTEAYDLLQPIMGRPVQFYTFSLAQDSSDTLKRYMEARGLYGRPGWKFLTAPKAVITDIRWGFGFFDADEELDSNLTTHTGMARFGNHRLDRWSSCPALANPKLTARSVVSLFPSDQRPYIAALDRKQAHPARKIPNFEPLPPSTQGEG